MLPLVGPAKNCLLPDLRLMWAPLSVVSTAEFVARTRMRGADASALPARALEAVMARYGAPFDPEAAIAVAGTLDLGDGRRLLHVRHLAGYDVIARDYLVYEVVARDHVVAGQVSHVIARDYLVYEGPGVEPL